MQSSAVLRGRRSETQNHRKPLSTLARPRNLITKHFSNRKRHAIPSYVLCPECGTQITFGAVLCPNCGITPADLSAAPISEAASTPSADVPCPACGTLMFKSYINCEACGSYLDPTMPQQIMAMHERHWEGIKSSLELFRDLMRYTKGEWSSIGHGGSLRLQVQFPLQNGWQGIPPAQGAVGSRPKTPHPSRRTARMLLPIQPR
ncbi:MAG: hypothetical protein LBQ79_07610 [Deltaproteobacteria bacterium]|nr:hypothetical protein [Deltaproteobacteria bacterium]